MKTLYSVKISDFTITEYSLALMCSDIVFLLHLSHIFYILDILTDIYIKNHIICLQYIYPNWKKERKKYLLYVTVFRRSLYGNAHYTDASSIKNWLTCMTNTSVCVSYSLHHFYYATFTHYHLAALYFNLLYEGHQKCGTFWTTSYSCGCYLPTASFYMYIFLFSTYLTFLSPPPYTHNIIVNKIVNLEDCQFYW